jgi:hypothetical protein
VVREQRPSDGQTLSPAATVSPGSRWVNQSHRLPSGWAGLSSRGSQTTFACSQTHDGMRVVRRDIRQPASPTATMPLDMDQRPISRGA